jgi:hypothetical protein
VCGRPHTKFRRVGEQVEVAEGAKEASLRHIVGIRRLNERQATAYTIRWWRLASSPNASLAPAAVLRAAVPSSASDGVRVD